MATEIEKTSNSGDLAKEYKTVLDTVDRYTGQLDSDYNKAYSMYEKADAVKGLSASVKHVSQIKQDMMAIANKYQHSHNSFISFSRAVSQVIDNYPISIVEKSILKLKLSEMEYAYQNIVSRIFNLINNL